jgi:pimeloyl-ACP methyl ester carboxylesterase
VVTRSPGEEVRLPDGRRLVFDDVGDPSGRVVFYLHGIPDSRWCRHPDDGIAKWLGIRLVSVDRPGYGDSDADPGETLLSFAEDVARLADHLGVAQFQTLGWSGGGLFALACAARDPSRVAGVGVASALAPATASRVPGITEGLDDQTALFVEAAGTMPASELAELATPILAGWPSEPHAIRDQFSNLPDPVARRELTETPGLIDQLADGVQLALRQGTVRVRRDLELLASDPGYPVADIGVPVQLWYGDCDAGAPPAMGRWYVDQLPHSTLNVVKGASHFVMFSRWRDILAWFATR